MCRFAVNKPLAKKPAFEQAAAAHELFHRMLGEPVFKFALSFQNGGVEPSICRQTADADRDAFLQIAADRRCLRRCALLLYRPLWNLARLLETVKADFPPVR